ncbi:MAG: CidA/LrgA family protein [Oscillospiraceae bacterium]|nr:CidA/LrgA family protein [Oscillospiraceae bacterium]
MKYLSQFCIILGFTLLGEALQRLIPLPIPASVYGLIALFAALCMGLIKVEQVKTASGFLISIMPVLFVAPTVGIAESWDLISSQLLPIFLLLLATTVLTFGISGCLTQLALKKGGERHD